MDFVNRKVHFMALHPRATGYAVSFAERPGCPNCTTRMTLATISAGPAGFDHRMFECAKCGRVQNVIVALDPMNSRAQGWLAGELKRPT